MGPRRAYGGDSIWLTGYFRGTLYYGVTHGEKASALPNTPFYSGGWPE